MKYKLRAECAHDVEQFIKKMEGYTWNHKVMQIKDFPDVEFTFDSEVNRERIKDILRMILDSHVMIETIKPLEEYTGERITEQDKLINMVRLLKNCIIRLTQDDVTQEQRDLEAYWIGEANELLTTVNTTRK